LKKITKLIASKENNQNHTTNINFIPTYQDIS
jgi:hypothetical protein